MIKTESAGGIILNKKGEVALVRSGMDGIFWGFPKGHVDAGEDALTAAKREILEESGIDDLRLITELPSYERYRGTPDGGDDPTELKVMHMFLFESDKATLQPGDPFNPEARWVALDEAEALLTHPKDKEYFRGNLEAINRRLSLSRSPRG